MKTNDIKKGMRVELSSGWYGTMLDNKKGNIRCVEVEGWYTEAGSVWAHDIVRARDVTGIWHIIEHTPEQIRLSSMIA